MIVQQPVLVGSSLASRSLSGTLWLRELQFDKSMLAKDLKLHITTLSLQIIIYLPIYMPQFYTAPNAAERQPEIQNKLALEI